MKKRSKEEKREEKEEKKGRKIPLRNYTKGGRKSSVIAGVNILLFILAVVISILKKGNAGIYVGLLMLLVMVSAIVGFVIGINSFKEENKFLKYTYRLLFFNKFNTRKMSLFDGEFYKILVRDILSFISIYKNYNGFIFYKVKNY